MKVYKYIFILVAILSVLLIELVRPGGFVSFAFSFLYTDDTVYVDQYSFVAWNRVGIGMSKKEVQEILGDPLDTWFRIDGTEVWNFTRSPGDTHYELRQVEFAKNNLVSKKNGYFYVD